MRKPHYRSFCVVLLLGSLVLVVSAVLSGCGNKHPMEGHQPPPPSVGVAKPIAQDIATTKIYTGHIEAIETVLLSPRVSGTVIAVDARDGALVAVGDPILRIDPVPFQATVTRIEAERARSAAQLDQAKQQHDRAKKLVTDKIVSQQTYDDAIAALTSATAQVAAADAALVTAKLDLSYTTVTAPIAGRLSKVLTTVGNLVQGGGPVPPTVLTTINRSDSVYAVFDVDEASWRQLAPRISTSIPVAVGLSGETGTPHAGTVAFADNQIDAASGSIRLRATLVNAQGLLTPGAFARVSVEIAPPASKLLIHEQAILAQLSLRYVLVVDVQGVTSFRPVQLGAATGALRTVESGLGPDEQIAVTNLAKIFYPGMTVSPVPASMQTATAVEAPATEAKPQTDAQVSP